MIYHINSKHFKAGLFPAVLAIILPLRAAVAQNASVELNTLAGPLPKTVQAEKGPYLVVADLEVPAGRQVTIEPGTVFLFKNFTGLHVQGRLVAEGTENRPIVFTSEYDRDYNPASDMYPNPYDWNGIYIHKDAIGTSMAYCRLSFSVYGIISETKFIRIISGVFTNNGKTNLVIEGEEHLAGQDAYTYELALKDATVDGVPINILKDPAAPKRNTLRYSGLAAFLGGCTLGVYNTFQWRNSERKLEDLSSTDWNNLVSHTSSDWQEARSERNVDRILTIAGYGLTIIGAAGFSWSFTF
jgi:hypothetical protein